MIRYIIKRLLQLIPILFAASVLIFFLVRLAPSDPIASMTEGRRISEEPGKLWKNNIIWIVPIRNSILYGSPTPFRGIWATVSSTVSR